MWKKYQSYLPLGLLVQWAGPLMLMHAKQYQDDTITSYTPIWMRRLPFLIRAKVMIEAYHGCIVVNLLSSIWARPLLHQRNATSVNSSFYHRKDINTEIATKWQPYMDPNYGALLRGAPEHSGEVNANVRACAWLKLVDAGALCLYIQSCSQGWRVLSNTVQISPRWQVARP